MGLQLTSERCEKKDKSASRQITALTATGSDPDHAPLRPEVAGRGTEAYTRPSDDRPTEALSARRHTERQREPPTFGQSATRGRLSERVVAANSSAAATAEFSYAGKATIAWWRLGPSNVSLLSPTRIYTN